LSYFFKEAMGFFISRCCSGKVPAFAHLFQFNQWGFKAMNATSDTGAQRFMGQVPHFRSSLVANRMAELLHTLGGLGQVKLHHFHDAFWLIVGQLPEPCHIN
jgi:hypothetical protein